VGKSPKIVNVQTERSRLSTMSWGPAIVPTRITSYLLQSILLRCYDSARLPYVFVFNLRETVKPLCGLCVVFVLGQRATTVYPADRPDTGCQFRLTSGVRDMTRCQADMMLSSSQMFGRGPLGPGMIVSHFHHVVAFSLSSLPSQPRCWHSATLLGGCQSSTSG
jgi:hypothetical protein